MSCPDHQIRTEWTVEITPKNIDQVEITLNGQPVGFSITGTGPSYTVTIPANEIDAVGTLRIKEGDKVLACRTIVN